MAGDVLQLSAPCHGTETGRAVHVPSPIVHTPNQKWEGGSEGEEHAEDGLTMGS